MEFKSLKNIETSFKQLRIFGIVFLCMCTIILLRDILYIAHTTLQKLSVRKYMYWMMVNR